MTDSKDVMNAQLEKFFFTWIMDHPTQFYKVEPDFFKISEEIQFVYKIVRDEFLVSKAKKIPSPQQIVAMIKLQDPEEKISNNIIKAIIKNDNSVHDQDWLERKFKAWKLSNMLKANLYQNIDEIRNMKDIDYDDVSSIASKIKAVYNNLSLIEDDDEDLGVDFDDAEMHKQDVAVNKIPSGWGNVDLLLGGGWDKGTFNVFMGETNAGKCTDYHTLIKIKNKITNEVKEIPIGEFYESLK